MQMKPPTSRWQ